MKKLEAEGILSPPEADEVGGLWLVNPVIPPIPPEDRVTKTMEVQEDINKKSEFCSKQEAEKAEIFPKQGEKMSKDAKKFAERLSQVRTELNNLDSDIKV